MSRGTIRTGSSRNREVRRPTETTAAPAATPELFTAPARPRAGANPLRWAVPVLSALGIAVSAYLTWVHYAGLEVVCIGTNGCETVQSSSYAEFFGIPVATLGLGMYGALLLLSLLWLRAGPDLAANAGLGIFGLSLIGVGYSAYLTYIELFVLHAICTWCVVSAILLVAIFASSAWHQLRGTE